MTLLNKTDNSPPSTPREIFSIFFSVLSVCSVVNLPLYATNPEERAPEVPLMVECPCPIILDTLQLDLELIKLSTPDPFEEQVIR